MPSFSLHRSRRIEPLPAQCHPGQGWAASFDGSGDDAGETLPAPLLDESVHSGREDLLESALTSASGQLWNESSWQLHRCAQQLLREPAGPHQLEALCSLAGQTVRLLRRVSDQAGMDIGLARRLGSLARQLCFEVVCQLSTVGDLGHRMAMLLAVAQVLDSLGDQQDAQAMREQALVGLRSLCRPRRPRVTQIGAVAAPVAPARSPALVAGAR
jgi:hypothetical protein